MNKSLAKTPVFRPVHFFYIFAALIVMTEIAALYFLALPLPGKISDSWNRLTKDRQETEALNTLVSTLASTDVTSLEETRQKVNAALPDEKKTAGIIFGLTRLASSSGVIVNSLEFAPGLVSTSSGSLPRETVPKKTAEFGVKSIPASLTLTAEIGPLARFLDDLAKVNQVIGVEQVSLSRTSGRTIADVSLILYYQPPKTGTITWKQIQPVTAAEQEILESLTGVDIFRIGPE